MKRKLKLVKKGQKGPKRRGKKAKRLRKTGPYTPPIVQAKIHLMRLEGKNTSEIAEELGINRKTAKKFSDTMAQIAEVAEVRSRIVSMLHSAVDRIATEIMDPQSQQGAALAMRSLENCHSFPTEFPAVATPVGEDNQFEQDVQNTVRRMMANMVRRNRIYGLPDPEPLAEPETRYLEPCPTAVNVPVKR